MTPLHILAVAVSIAAIAFALSVIATSIFDAGHARWSDPDA